MSLFEKIAEYMQGKRPSEKRGTQYPPQYMELFKKALKKPKLNMEAANEIIFKDKLSEFVSGKTKIKDEELQAEFNNIFHHEKLFVLMFSLDMHKDLFKDDTNITDDQRLSSLKLIISNVYKEFIYTVDGICCFMDIEDKYVCIVNLSKFHSRMHALKAFNQSNENIIKYFGVTLKAALSSDIQSFEQLYRGYAEAVTANEFFKIDDSKLIWSFADMVENGFNSEQYEIPRSRKEDFSEILSYISNSNLDGAKKSIFQFIKAYLTHTGLSFTSFKFISYEISINIINKFRDYILDEQYIDDIFRQTATPVNEIIKLVEHICYNVKDDTLARNAQTDKKEILVNDIIKYIESNYDDMDLNIAKLAEQFDYVPSYISKIFKSIKNVSLIDYINKKRIEEAKHLLISTDKVLVEIAAKTGFYSDAALIRVFKKHEGTTPVAYKKDYFNKD